MAICMVKYIICMCFLFFYICKVDAQYLREIKDQMTNITYVVKHIIKLFPNSMEGFLVRRLDLFKQ